MISPEITDLCDCRATSSFSPGPATDNIALLIDSELPQVEKKVWSARTASAISSWALASTPCETVRSSSPLIEMTSLSKTSRPTMSRTLGSTPRP
jgi:hypothetical protein